MKIHVTGREGFIAGHLIAELERRGHEVTSSGMAEAMAPELYLGAGGRGSGWEPPAVVVHAGAIVGRELRGLGIEPTIGLNASSTAILASACEGTGTHLVYLSSSEVYGPRYNETPAAESDPIDSRDVPHNLYGLTKLWGEQACRLYQRNGMLTVARLSMPYGPGHHPGSGRAALTNFLWDAMYGYNLSVHRGARRSWLWVGDAVDALCRLIEWGIVGTFNIAREDNECSMLEVAELALELVAGSESKIELVDPPEGFTLVKRLDTEKISGIGWRPTVSLEDGMKRTLAWLEGVAREEEAHGRPARIR